jgi:phosphate transport system substrate-binding protein
MGDRNGRCPNIGNCTIADRRIALDVAETAGGRCSECGRTLMRISARAGDRIRPWPWIIAAAAAVAVLATLPVAGTLSGLSSLIAGHAAAAAPPIILTLAGSDMLGTRLGRAWAAGFLNQRGFVRMEETAPAPGEILVTGRRAEGREGASILIEMPGTAAGFEALAAGGADIAMAARPVDGAAMAALAPLGDMRAAASEHVVALDGIAVIVHPVNPVTRLSAGQLADLFSGKVKNWSQLGGANLPVTVYVRDDRSETWDAFRARILVPAKRGLTPAAVRFEANEPLVDAVATDAGGIGVVRLTHVGSTRALALGETGGTAVHPDRATIASGDYPLARRLFFYSAAQPRAEVASLLAFVLSSAGQDIARDQGFVPGPSAPAPPTATASGRK